MRRSGVTDKALKIGDRAPDFELPKRGKQVELSELTARGPVVVTWYRGGWCPYCNVALRGFEKSLQEFRAEVPPWSRSRPTPDDSLSAAEKNHLEFEVLERPGNEVAQLAVWPTGPRSHRRAVQGAPRPGQVQRRRCSHAPPWRHLRYRSRRDHPLRVRRRRLPQTGRALFVLAAVHSLAKKP